MSYRDCRERFRYSVVWYIEDKNEPLGNSKCWKNFQFRKDAMNFRDAKKTESNCINAFLFGE